MQGPPDPEMRNRPAANGTANRRAEWKKPQEIIETAADLQSRKLCRLYSLCEATACTIAHLAFGVCR
jgi:hypothetical protein